MADAPQTEELQVPGSYTKDELQIIYKALESVDIKGQLSEIWSNLMRKTKQMVDQS